MKAKNFKGLRQSAKKKEKAIVSLIIIHLSCHYDWLQVINAIIKVYIGFLV
jgi:hypothetical protein